MPADSIVASWRVKTSSSPLRQEALVACLRLLPALALPPPPPNRPPALLMSIGVRLRRRRSATTSFWESAVSVPRTVLPAASRASNLNVVAIVASSSSVFPWYGAGQRPARGRLVGHRDRLDLLETRLAARRVEQPAAAQCQHAFLQRLRLDIGEVRALDDHALDGFRHSHRLEQREAALVAAVAARTAGG